MIGAITSLLFPGAILVDELDRERALKTTQKLLQLEKVVLLEAAFESRGKYARTDIVIK